MRHTVSRNCQLRNAETESCDLEGALFGAEPIPQQIELTFWARCILVLLSFYVEWLQLMGIVGSAIDVGMCMGWNLVLPCPHESTLHVAHGAI